MYQVLQLTGNLQDKIMYNRILKRPMFKRGGSSFQSQGTGITSPYDTPRKNYKIGSWGEWEEQTRALTKDPRGDFSYAAQGFSELGNPYKESGEAKMISEMLHAGAGAVRGSREKASDLEQKGELAILESQAGRKLTDEERAWKEEQAEEKHKRDLELVDRQAKSQWNKDFRPARAISELADSIRRTAEDFTFSKENAFGVAQGEYAIAQLIEQERGDNVDIISDTYWTQDDKTNDWSYDPTKLSAKKVWWDPQMKKWAVFPDKNDDGKADGAPTYFGVQNFEAAENALLTGAIPTKSKATSSTENGKGNEIIESTDLVEKITGDFTEFDFNDKGAILDEAAKLNITIVEKQPGDAKNWKSQLGEREMSLVDFTEILKRKQLKDKYANIKGRNKGNIYVAQKATGGRIGYAEGDVAITELDELNAWWKDQLNSANWKSEIKNEG